MRGGSPGIVVLITDLMDKSGYEAALRMLVGRRMDVFVIHLLSPEELEPPLRGDLRLIDCEDGDVTEITMNSTALRKYRARANQAAGPVIHRRDRQPCGLLPELLHSVSRAHRPAHRQIAMSWGR